MLGNTLLALRDHARIRAIGGVVARFGIQDIIERLGLSDLWPDSKKKSQDAERERTAPERLRYALEALGPCFVKLGQILATRADILSPAWTKELEKLQDTATTLPWPEIENVLVQAMGELWRDQFAQFDTQPIAAASMAQVYRARLNDGTEVVVKVQRPGLESVISADLRLLALLAELMQERGLFLHYRLPDMVRTLSLAMLDELDFTREAGNSERIRDQLRDLDYVRIPRVYMSLCAPTVMVQEFIDGVHASDTAGLEALGANRSLLAKRGSLAFLHMVLQNGLYHADPHPGNVMALPDDKIAFIDFGLVGSLSGRRKQQLLILLRAIVEGRADELSVSLMEWSGNDALDWTRLDESAQQYVARQAQGKLRISLALTELMALAREQHLVLPSDLVLLFKALITAEGVLLKLDPQFDIAHTVAPVIKRALRQEFSPRNVSRDLMHLALESRQIVLDAPQLVRLLMHRLRSGQLDARIELRGIAALGRSLEMAATRLAIAIVTAACLLVLGPVLMRTGPSWLGLSIFSWLGLLAAAAGIVVVVRGFWRRRG